jgi:hypothetical protein
MRTYFGIFSKRVDPLSVQKLRGWRKFSNSDIVMAKNGNKMIPAGARSDDLIIRTDFFAKLD